MKTILFTLFLVLSSSSFAAIVESAKLDATGENILVEVSYSGGCKEHKFSLKLDLHCLETNPVQCSADVIEEVINGPDYCEAYITRTVSFNLKEYKLDDAYYSGAHFNIFGDLDFNGQRSNAAVILPQ